MANFDQVLQDFIHSPRVHVDNLVAHLQGVGGSHPDFQKYLDHKALHTRAYQNAANINDVAFKLDKLAPHIEQYEAGQIAKQIEKAISTAGGQTGRKFTTELEKHVAAGNKSVLSDLLYHMEEHADSKAMTSLLEKFEKGNWTWGEALANKAGQAGNIGKSALKKSGDVAHTLTVKPSKWVLAKGVGIGKIVGFGAAALVGAGLISSYLSGKREQSAEAMANEPSQAPMDFNPSFGPAYAGPTGNVPPVEGDWVAKTRGGEMNRATMPSVPDVASRAQAVEQSRSDAGVTSSTLAV